MLALAFVLQGLFRAYHTSYVSKNNYPLRQRLVLFLLYAIDILYTFTL
jgi:hypothetical protein